MKAEEFYALVADMRNAQKEYFRSRSKDWLSRSKQLESKVDSEIKKRIENANQTTLFE